MTAAELCRWLQTKVVASSLPLCAGQAIRVVAARVGRIDGYIGGKLIALVTDTYQRCACEQIKHFEGEFARCRRSRSS